jgi:hypothetical protein
MTSLLAMYWGVNVYVITEEEENSSITVTALSLDPLVKEML